MADILMWRAGALSSESSTVNRITREGWGGVLIFEGNRLKLGATQFIPLHFACLQVVGARTASVVTFFFPPVERASQRKVAVVPWEGQLHTFALKFA